MSRRLHVLTVATRREGYMPLMERKARELGLDLHVIGLGRRWGGWTTRMDWLIEYVARFPAEDVVLIMDAYDTYLMADEAEILEKYDSFGKPMVVGAERRLGVDALVYTTLFRSWNSPRPLSSEPGYSHPNAGAVITTVAHATRFLPVWRALTAKTGDDQRALVQLATERDDVALDRTCTLFQNVSTKIAERLRSDYYRLRIEDGRLVNDEFGTRPALLHGPGNRDLCPFLTRLTASPTCPQVGVNGWQITKLWQFAYQAAYGWWPLSASSCVLSLALLLSLATKTKATR